MAGKGSAKGERRGGRKAGVPNKVTRSIREMASQHSEMALNTLKEIAADASAPHAARVSASNALLDRAHGKPAQTIEGTGTGGAIVVEVVKFGAAKADDPTG